MQLLSLTVLEREQDYSLAKRFSKAVLIMALVIQVLNPKVGITLRVTVTSATILTAKRTIHKMVLLAVRMVAVADVTETRNVIPSLRFKTCMTSKT